MERDGRVPGTDRELEVLYTCGQSDPRTLGCFCIGVKPEFHIGRSMILGRGTDYVPHFFAEVLTSSFVVFLTFLGMTRFSSRDKFLNPAWGSKDSRDLAYILRCCLSL